MWLLIGILNLGTILMLSTYLCRVDFDDEIGTVDYNEKYEEILVIVNKNHIFNSDELKEKKEKIADGVLSNQVIILDADQDSCSTQEILKEWDGPVVWSGFQKPDITMEDRNYPWIYMDIFPSENFLKSLLEKQKVE